MEQTFSRRNFVAGGIGALAMGALGVMPAIAGEPLTTDSVESWDYVADVVICGAGAAGVLGAREAVLQGLSCIVIEAAPRELAGGASACFGGFYVPSPAAAFTGLSEEDAQLLAEKAQESLDWMLANGLPVGEVMKVEGAGRGFYETLDAAVEAMEIPVLYETRAIDMVRDAQSGAVMGVVAEQPDGTLVHLAGRRGVLVATGGIAENQELLNTFFFPDVEILNTSSPYNRGDGLVMGMRVGAKLHNMARFGVEIQNLAFTKASREVGTALVCKPAGPNAAARIVVNGSGERFMNDEQDLSHFKGLCPWLQFPGAPQLGGYEGYINLPMYLVCDSQMMDSEKAGEGLIDYGWAISKDVYRWSVDNQEEVARGWIAKGDTIEELVANLAEQSGNAPINAAALQETIDAWNDQADSGTPDPFGRIAVQAINQPPYYAAEMSMTLMYTIGGLTAAGADGQTLDWTGEVIAGLWHAGDVGQCATTNPLGACPASTMGTLAVRNMASAPSRDIAGDILCEIKLVGEKGRSVAEKGMLA